MAAPSSSWPPLAMSAPGEYALAVEAGWSQTVAWLMPVVVSVYAAVAAVIAATRPKGSADDTPPWLAHWPR
ncbi:hypothetical protein [Streptomyces diacarni]|uniref:hypothetical protein n=1 Tax=Streptomyces diacarni TaxID=2800381 RepID=UPI0011C06193|nr:hypothetical protein [Streptomyces diacarni]